MPLLSKNGKELLFIHIPKCGGTSLEKIFGSDVQLTLLHSGPGELPCSPQHFQAGLLEKLFDYRVPPSVVIVRNPFDRIVSEYRYQVQNDLQATKSGFDKFVENSLGEFWKNKYVHDNHIRPQIDFVCTETVIFRFEDNGVNEAYKYIVNFLGLTNGREVPVKNSSEQIDFPISPDTLRLINKFYARDFALFGYRELEAGSDVQSLSSLNYSSKAISALPVSSVIRQRVSDDLAVVAEEYRAQTTAKMERLEGDQRLASDAVSDLVENLNQQSVKTDKMKELLEGIRLGLDSTDQHLAVQIARINDSLTSSGLTLEGVKEDLGRVVSITTEGFLDQLGKQVVRDEHIVVTLSGLADKLLGLDRDIGTLGRNLTEALHAEREFTTDRISQDRKSWIASNQDKIEEAIDKIVTELRSSIKSGQSKLSESVEILKYGLNVELRENATQLDQKLSGIEHELGKTAGKIVGDMNSSFQSHTTQVSEIADKLRESRKVALIGSSDRTEQKLSSIESEFTQFRLEQETSRQEGEREIVEAFKSLFELKQQEIYKLDERLAATDAQLAESKSREMYLHIELETARALQSSNSDKLETITARAIAIEQENAALTQVSEIADQLRESLNVLLIGSSDRTEQKLSSIESEFTQFRLEQETSRQEGEREIVEAFKALFELKQQEICKLDERLAATDAQLAESKSREISLHIELETARALQSSNSDKLETITARAIVLEQENATLAEESSLIMKTMDQMQRAIAEDTAALGNERDELILELDALNRTVDKIQRSHADMNLAWDKERESMLNVSSSLARTIEEMQHSSKYKASAWEKERVTLTQESTSLKHAIEELRSTLLLDTAAWRHEREALAQLAISQGNKIEELQRHELEMASELLRTIEDAQKREQELNRELLETVDRFHAEIDYREALKNRNSVLEAELTYAIEKNKELFASTSFKVTKPLRVLSRVLRFHRPANTKTKVVLRLQDLREDAKASQEEAELDDGTAIRISQLKVAIVVENLDRGGLEQVVLDHARYFSSHCKSLDLFVINETGQACEQALRDGIYVFCVRNQKEPLEQFLSQKHYDIAFFHHSYGYLPVFRPFIGKLIEVVHNEYAWQRDIEFFETIRKQTVDKYIAVSDPVREYSISKLAIKESDIVTIVNGLNVEGLIRPPIEVLQESRKKTFKDSPVFVMSANGQAQKNHVLVIRAFIQILKKYPKAKLQLAGNLAVDKHVEKAIVAELEKFGKPTSIELMGSLNRRALSKVLAHAHIAVLPTKYEGFSMATLEYLYFGLPMILSNTGGASYIENNYGGVIVDKKIARLEGEPTAVEERSLTSSMLKAVEHYDLLGEKSKIAAKSYLSYSVEAACLRYLKTYS